VSVRRDIKAVCVNDEVSSAASASAEFDFASGVSMPCPREPSPLLVVARLIARRLTGAYNLMK
jgi:hypothetical protein